MDNENLNQNTTNESTEQISPEQEQMSFSDKLIGIFSEPGKVFSEFRQFPIKTVDWLIPTLLSIVIVILSQMIQMNNPTIKQDLRDKQIKAMQKYVDEGRMTPEQLDQAVENMDRYQSFQYIGIFVGIPIVSFIVLFIVALVYLLLGKYGLRGDPKYVSILAVVGIVNMIGIVEVLITTILSILLGKMQATPSVALLFSQMSQGPAYALLNKINPFTFWELVVIGIGLAKVSNKEVIKGIYWVFGLWIVFTLLAVFALSKIPFLGGLAG